LFHDDPVRYKASATSAEFATELVMASKTWTFVAILSLAWLGWPQTGLQGEPPVFTPEPLGTGVPKQTLPAISVPSQPSPMVPAGPSLAAAGDMIGFSTTIAGGTQAITLINASRRWMAVYHVDQAGQIRLVSSRPLDADFSFQFNATAPLPEEIRRLQKR